MYSRFREKLDRLRRLFHRRAMKPREVRRLDVAEANRVIASAGLVPIQHSWHYSYDIERFYREMFLYEDGAHVYVYQKTAIHEWAPIPVFSNDTSLSKIFATAGKDGRFWYVRLETFETFLERRSRLSANPRHNFPSAQTYRKYRRKANCSLEQYRLVGHEQLFTASYDHLKAPKYRHTGAQCLAGALASNPVTPKEWLIIYLLRENTTDVVMGVALAVDDGRSCSLINIASVLDSAGYGLYMHVAIIQDLCQRAYGSLDGGVSAAYGHYKDKIFLDALPIDNSGVVDFRNERQRPPATELPGDR